MIRDLSEITDLNIDDKQMGNCLGYNKLILSKATESVHLKRVSIREIQFQCQYLLRSIIIYDCPKVIQCSLQYEDKSCINLQLFSKLAVVTLYYVKNNILLPNRLQELNLWQNGQYKILNQSISCPSIYIANFDLTDISIEDCYSIKLSGKILSGDILDLSQMNALKIVKMKNLENDILLPYQLDKLVLYQDDMNYKLLNKSISYRSITIYNYDLTNVVLESCSTLSLRNIKVSRNIIDLSKIINLKVIVLRNVRNDIIVPNYLDKLYLRSSRQCKLLNQSIACNDATINNYDLTDIFIDKCQYINLINCVLSNFTFKSLEIQILSTIKKIQLVNYSLNSNPSNLDLSLFQKNNQIYCSGIRVGPIIEEFHISNKENVQLEFLDFSLCKSVKKAFINNYYIKQVFMINNNTVFKNCQINLINLRTTFSVNFDIESFSAKNDCGKYIINFRDNTRQQIVYKKVGRTYKQINFIPFILVNKIYALNKKIQQIIDE